MCIRDRSKPRQSREYFPNIMELERHNPVRTLYPANVTLIIRPGFLYVCSRKFFLPPDFGIHDPNSKKRYSPAKASIAVKTQMEKNISIFPPQLTNILLGTENIPDPKILEMNNTIVEKTPKCLPCGTSNIFFTSSRSCSAFKVSRELNEPGVEPYLEYWMEE